MGILQQKVYVLDATLTDEVDLEVIHSTPHVFIGIVYLDGGGLLVTPSAGTFSITIKTSGSDGFESIPSGDNIDATASIATLSYSTNATDLKYTPAGVTGAVNVQITVTGNSS